MLIPGLQFKHRLRALIGSSGTVYAHELQASLFTLAFYFMLPQGGFGNDTGSVNGSQLSAIQDSNRVRHNDHSDSTMRYATSRQISF